MIWSGNHPLNRFSSNHLTLVLLLPAVLWLFTNSLINRHNHRLPSGVVIQHAHPWQNAGDRLPFQSHKHSEQEIACFDQFAAISTLLIGIMTLVILLLVLRLAVSRFTTKAEILNQKIVYRLRPPPFFL
ncbi:MAG: hypothetical protein JNL22_07720 [Bacteroidales bacterium]|jgi:hypothetical protein|nr:hypothetical protein [Bacteroidales bacterium]